MRRLAIGIVVLALSSHGVAALNIDPALNVDVADELSHDASPAESAISETPAAPAQGIEAPLPPMQGRARNASNPLWAIPLAALSGTRERPVFSSSRRPPPAIALAPVVKPAAVAPKPKEPERPKLSLVGTITNGNERFGIFVDQSTKLALRLRMGDDYQGWTLRAVQGREATLEKDQEAVILALPEAGASQPASDVRLPPSNAAMLLSATSPSRRERSSH
jgi:general secretion pathway protein N